MNQTLYKLLLSYLFLCFSFSKSYSLTIQTASSGNWNTPSIWKGGVVPTIEDDVIILATHTITVPTLNVDTDSYCNSLIINGMLIVKNGTIVIGNWGTRASFCLVNGTLQLEGDYNHQLKVHGYMNLNGGSKFLMHSGVLNLDGCSGKESTSVAAKQAIFDIGNAQTFKATAGAIIITNPHFHPTGVCVRGVQKFENTLVWGNNLHTPVLSPNDFVISETEKPILANMRLSYIPYPNKNTRFSTKDLEISGILNVNSGIYYGSGTLKMSKDLLLGDSVLLESNVEFNGLTQQNILTYGTNTSGIIKGNVTVNNPDRVKIKIDLEIKNGKLIFIQGKLDLSVKTLTLQSQPVGANANRYVISFDLYQNIGNLLIKNVSDTTLFPLGSEVAYLPVTLTATSGDFSVSAYPFTLDSIRVAQGFSSLNTEWQIKRMNGSATATVEFQWNGSNESTVFSTKRANCNLYRFENKNWKVIGDTTGPTTVKGSIFTKKVRFIDNFTNFTLFSSPAAVVTSTQDLGSTDASIAYPNPLSESSILTVKLTNPSTVKIYDVHARLISESRSQLKDENVNFETHQWAKGIYFIHITNLLGSKMLVIFKH